MKATTREFKVQARTALANTELQRALGKAKGGFIDKRRLAMQNIPDFEALRQRGKEIKNHALAHLDTYLDHFAGQVEAQGGKVHWANDGASATDIIAAICQRVGAKSVTKSKSMAGEEINLNEALEAKGFEMVETDLGEYIIQLAKEPPSHIIAPAVHKTREEITRLFDHHHHQIDEQRLREVPELVDEARQVLRDKFLNADVGISGANFLVSETGSIVLVTNEGNADLTVTLPKVHIVIAGIEKIVPTLDDASTLLRLLGRSATGQDITAYTTFLTGPKRADDQDGPTEYHVVLLDNGRSRMLGNDYRDMLRCIRCGACLNHCPVYSSVGGHAYGWVYPGPMGSVLTPQFLGLKATYDLPNACTLNGRCMEVCPVKIPLSDMLRQLRSDQWQAGLGKTSNRLALKLWGWAARHPGLYQFGTRLALPVMRLLGGGKGMSKRLPGAGAWTAGRDFPLPQGGTFQAQWKKYKGNKRK